MRAEVLRRARMVVAILAAVAVSDAVGFAQYAAPAAGAVERAERTAHIELIDERGERFQIVEEDLDELTLRSLEVADGERTLTYEGVSLYELLEHYGVGFGEQLKGRRTPTVVLCEAHDDYRVVFALHEVDPDTNDKVVLLAFRVDCQPLPAEEGPFRLLTPGEKRRVRAIRMLARMRIVSLLDLPMTTAPGGVPRE